MEALGRGTYADEAGKFELFFPEFPENGTERTLKVRLMDCGMVEVSLDHLLELHVTAPRTSSGAMKIAYNPVLQCEWLEEEAIPENWQFRKTAALEYERAHKPYVPEVIATKGVGLQVNPSHKLPLLLPTPPGPPAF